MTGGPAYDPGTRAAAYEDFVRRFPAFRATAALDALRAADYARLDRLGHTYLDYTGGGLYGESQLRRHHELLAANVLGNPHSQNPTSRASAELATQARDAVRRFFNAPEGEFEIVFTANASGALKLVGEAFPFGPGGVYLLSYDNHNSVNGIRAFAAAKGAAVSYIPVREEDLRLDPDQVRTALRGAGGGAPKLFAYPAQSNFSGAQHPLEWVAEARELGWAVLLDCAAFAPTNPVDAQAIGADFIPVSFYKLFGYPTGCGCLIARREALARLRRPWFAGGTIAFASVQREEWFRLAPGATGFEDGTIDYLGLPAVTVGIEHLERAGLSLVHERVTALTGWLLEETAALRHRNGAPLVKVFGPPDTERRGATVALYLLDPDGVPYDVYGVEAAAARELISVRSGCFCNPGDGEVAHRISRDDVERCFSDPAAAVTLSQCQQRIADATGKAPNTIRVSLGLVSDFADVHRFLAFAATYRDRPPAEAAGAARESRPAAPRAAGPGAGPLD